MVLVQVAESNDDGDGGDESSHRLDFHGQSGAVGRFEADDDGVVLDLRGYQYRGTLRPGPTAMVVSLTRDGRYKVEAIADEFVSLDASTRTNVMDKLDAVVTGGGMDETYLYREEDVNATDRRGKRGQQQRQQRGEIDDDDDDDGGGNNGGAEGGGVKRKRGAAKGGGGAKRRKVSTKKK